MKTELRKLQPIRLAPIAREVKQPGDWTGGEFIDHLEECRRMLNERLGPTIAGARPAMLRYLTDQGMPQHIATVVIENQLIEYLTRRGY
jgi:hypothetical protein